MRKAFPTQEIGSLPKFSWRTKPFRDLRLEDADLELAKDWGKRLRVAELSSVLKLLSKRQGFSKDEKRKIVEYSIQYALAMQEAAGEEFGAAPGLDLVWSGEQAVTEMYETPVSNIGGFEFIGRVRSFDNKYWKEASVTGKPAFRKNYHADEFLVTKRCASRRLKVPVTDAITIMAWSDNQYYNGKWAKSGLPPSARSFSARREFTLEVAKVIRRVIKELIEMGAEEFQLDSPAATQYQSVEDAKLVMESFNETVKGLNATFGLHTCFPPRRGYAMLFPYLLDTKCTKFSFEYANRDTYSRGSDSEKRTGYADLNLFKEYGYRDTLGIGVVHIHTDKLPSVSVVSDRILYAAKVTDLPPENLYINPDCGLRTRGPDVAYSMLGLVSAGAERARRELGVD